MKGIVLAFLNLIFEVQKKSLMILSKSFLLIFVSLKKFITWRGELGKFTFIWTILPGLERKHAFQDINSLKF